MGTPEWLVRHAVFPLHEKLRGRQTLREMRDLDRILRLPPDAVRRLCAARLGELLRFAREKLPYYAERFAASGVEPDADDPFAELAKLPVLRKPDVRRNAKRMTHRGVRGGLQACASGGTSGDTLHFYVDRKRQSQSMGARLLMQARLSVRPGDRRAWLWASPLEVRKSRVRRWRDSLINERVFNAFEMSPGTMDEYLRRIRAFRPRLLMGYSSAVALLARHAAGRYRPQDFPWLRAAVLTGDEIHPEYRDVVAKTFGCRVAGEYGSREVGLIAHECERGRLHVISPHVHVEIVQDGQRVEAGRAGSIICTNLNSRAQPLIRYALGDIGRLVAEPCDCGLPLPVLEIQAARITGYVALPGGRLCDGHIMPYLIRVDPHVIEFKVYQRALDAFEVLLVVERGCAESACAGVRQRFRQSFGPDVRVVCRTVDRIPPDPSGKRRQLISDVAETYEDFAVVTPGVLGSRTVARQPVARA